MGAGGSSGLDYPEHGRTTVQGIVTTTRVSDPVYESDWESEGKTSSGNVLDRLEVL